MTSTLDAFSKECVCVGDLHVTVLRFQPSHLSYTAKAEFIDFCKTELREGIELAVIDLSRAVSAEDFGSDYPEVATRVHSMLARATPGAKMAICLPENRLETFRSYHLDKLMYVARSPQLAISALESWPRLAPQPKKREEAASPAARSFVCKHCGAVNVLF